MKKFLILIPFLFIVLLIGYIVENNKSSDKTKKDEVNNTTPSPQVNESQLKSYIGYQEFSFNWEVIADVNKIKLIPNWEERIYSADFINRNKCQSLSSAGFYTKDFKPIGLFYSNNTELSKYKASTLFNGFFIITGEDKAFITNVPIGKYKIALQTGPLIMQNSEFINLNIFNSDTARRNLLAITDKNEVVLISIYKTNSIFDGPAFQQVQELLKTLEKTEGLDFISIINLDGGSASVFKNNYVYLSELSVVGSYFCIN